ncbi:hypothetical protein DFH06DRAFT_746068 [Mycena polygramma]|nr:hypothetical protein DFH06DRAFT_746068 [Mycena polygramma]
MGLGRTMAADWRAFKSFATTKTSPSLRACQHPKNWFLCSYRRGQEEHLGVSLIRGLAPYVPGILSTVQSGRWARISDSNTFDSAVLACADSGYFGCNRLGELLPISSTSFDPTRFATRENVSFGTDNHGIHFYDIKAPWTKTTGFEGASLLVSEQAELDPISTMHHHLVINRAVPDSSPLFSFQTAKGWSVLTKDLFLTRCNEIWTDSGLPCMTGHSFRIGGATEMLARGIPPEIVAKQGRWRSDAFLIYWRRIELILPLWTSSSPNSLSRDGIRSRVESWTNSVRSHPRAS